MFLFWYLSPCCLILSPFPLQEFMTGQAPFGSGKHILVSGWTNCFVSGCFAVWAIKFCVAIGWCQCLESVAVMEQRSSLWYGCDGMCYRGIPIRVLSTASGCGAGSMGFATFHLHPGAVCSTRCIQWVLLLPLTQHLLYRLPLHFLSARLFWRKAYSRSLSFS